VDVLLSFEVRVYRVDRPDQPDTFRRGERADAEPALPGWSMPVDELLKSRR